MKRSLTSLLFFVLLQTCFSQNLDNFKEREPFSFSGNIAVGSSFYNADGREDRRNPFAYYIVASPTLSLYEFDIPVSFTYRDQKGSVSTPFSRITINPTYKWIKVGIGNTSLNLSPYTLSGQYFTGASVELTPGNFRFKAGYGNLENPLAQIDTLIEGPLLLPTYKRKAVAASVGYGSSRNYIDLMFFRAKDDTSGADAALVDKSILKPEENLVIGSKFGVSILKLITLKANVGASAHTANQESASDLNYKSSSNSLGRFEDIFTNNLSSKLQFAGDASINLKIKRFGIGFEYKRVDPLYKSLGTYYFQEDYQNFTAKLNFSLFKNKIRFRGSGGIQENNLNKLRSSTRQRKIFNGTLTVSPTRKFTTTIRMANYTSDRTPVLNTLNDSLQFTQTTETYSVVPMLILTGDKVNTTIVAMVNYQKLIDMGLDLTGSRGVDNYIGNVSYSMYLKEPKLSLTASVLGNKNIIGDMENARIGANVTASKKFMENKFSVSANLGYTKNFINTISDGSTITGNLGLRYKVKKSISISLNTNALSRESDIVSYKEYRGTAKVTYQFTTKK